MNPLAAGVGVTVALVAGAWAVLSEKGKVISRHRGPNGQFIARERATALNLRKHATPPCKGRSAWHLVPNGERWSVYRVGARKAARTFTTQAEALKFGQKIARKCKHSHLVVHDEAGVIVAHTIYGDYKVCIGTHG